MNMTSFKVSFSPLQVPLINLLISRKLICFVRILCKCFYLQLKQEQKVVTLFRNHNKDTYFNLNENSYISADFNKQHFLTVNVITAAFFFSFHRHPNMCATP